FINTDTGRAGTNIHQAHALLTLFTHQAIFGTGHRVKHNVIDTDVAALKANAQFNASKLSMR
ncbi:hypothetical protein R0J93_23120, partial [Pseudoalteromonas sp. SIMBA_148]